MMFYDGMLALCKAILLQGVCIVCRAHWMVSLWAFGIPRRGTVPQSHQLRTPFVIDWKTAPIKHRVRRHSRKELVAVGPEQA